MVHILKQCVKEVRDFPEEVRGDLADALARLEEGHTLSMPLSSANAQHRTGRSWLRFRDGAGIYRVIYVFAGFGRIYLLHAFMKKTQQTSRASIDTAKRRLKEIL